MIALLTRLFVKNREDVSSPQVRRAYGTLVGIVSMIVNILLFAAKLTVGTLIGSMSITADAVNNLSDAGSQIISLISFRISAKPADREHPFGHARIEYIASMLVSLLILFVGLELLRESIAKILHPDPPERSWVAAVVLLVSILLKLWLGSFNRRIGKRIRSDVMRATAADCVSDAFATLAVLLSTVVLLLFPQLPLNLDAYMGVIVAVLIMVAGFRILNDAKNSILGEAPSDEIVHQITEIVEGTEGVLGIHDLIVHNYGPGHVIAALHVEVDGKTDIFQSHDMIDNVERRLRRECGIEATIHMDPVVTDDETVDLLRSKTQAAVRLVDDRLRIHDFRCVIGATHTNLIFDVAVPFELKMTDAELEEQIALQIQAFDPTCFAVLTVDRA